jgi:hypothetical protein
MCAIGVEKQSRNALLMRDPASPQLKLAILAMRAAEGPIKIDSVGHR